LAAHLTHVAQQLLSRNQSVDGFIKIIVSAGTSDNGFKKSGAPSFLILAYQYDGPPTDLYTNGATIAHTTYQRDIPQIKSTNYLLSASKADSMMNNGWVDILYHYNDIITECSRCNFFIIHENEILTPAENILEGITRHRVINLKNPPLPIRQGTVRIGDLQNANEAFITSTTKGVMPITQIGEIQIADGSVGPICQTLMSRINQWDDASDF